jgi:hypothetical protein
MYTKNTNCTIPAGQSRQIGPDPSGAIAARVVVQSFAHTKLQVIDYLSGGCQLDLRQDFGVRLRRELSRTLSRTLRLLTTRNPKLSIAFQRSY